MWGRSPCLVPAVRRLRHCAPSQTQPSSTNSPSARPRPPPGPAPLARKGIGDFIFNGQGRWADRSLSDGKPTWRYQDDRPSIEMFTAGGWRTMYSLAQAVADGVSDEFRDQGNGEGALGSGGGRGAQLWAGGWGKRLREQ